MPDGFSGAWRQVVDVDFPNAGSMATGLLLQQTLFAQSGLQLLAATIITCQLFEMPAQFPEQKSGKRAVFGRIISPGGFGVGQPGFLFGIFDDIAVAAGEFLDDRQVLGGILLFDGGCSFRYNR